jgi:hypothetical protein
MTTCLRCQQPINPEAITCPHCGNQLKAFGHPGIPLYQATGESFLCSQCLYHEDDTCNYPQRPYAKSCTLFHDKSLPLVEEVPLSCDRNVFKNVQLWCQRNRGLVILFVLVIISVLLALN